MRDIGCTRWYLFFVHLEQYNLMPLASPTVRPHYIFSHAARTTGEAPEIHAHPTIRPPASVKRCRIITDGQRTLRQEPCCNQWLRQAFGPNPGVATVGILVAYICIRDRRRIVLNPLPRALSTNHVR